MEEFLLAFAKSAGTGAVLAVVVWLEMRKAHAKQLDWLMLIHSRLGGLGASSIAPPVAGVELVAPRRRGGRIPRLRTAPTGYPVQQPDDEEPDR